MSGRRAIITTTDLRAMAKVVAEHGVTFSGRVDPLGALVFSIVPATARNDDEIERDEMDAAMQRYLGK